MSRERILVIDDSQTILKLVQLVLTKAGFEVTTATGGPQAREAAEAERPSLIIIDTRLPDDGTRSLCATLRGELNLAAVPVVLMGVDVGATDQLERLAEWGPNVSDAIRKPFTPEALVAVVAHALAKRAPREGVPEGGEADVDSLSLLPREPAATPNDGGVADPTSDPNAALAGDLAVIALADLLSLLDSELQTGTLSILRKDARLRIYLSGGRIAFATAEGVPDEFLLGRFLVRAGALDTDTLASALEARRSSVGEGETLPLLGSYLVDSGLVPVAALARAVTMQTAALVFESLRWGAGRFAFAPLPELPSPARDAGADLAVPALLMEGFRRVDEWRLIEREVGHFDRVFVRDEERVSDFGRGRLTREELAVLELCDGRRSVRDVIDRAQLGAFDTTKMLYRLLRTRLIRGRVAPVATAGGA